MKTLVTLFIPLLFVTVQAWALPPGCMTMNGKTQCIERQGRPTPKWQQKLQQRQALSNNCHQWIDIYRKEPTRQNKAYRDMACNRFASDRIHVDEQVREIMNGAPR